MVRLYLPGQGNLVVKQAGAPTEASETSPVTIETVKDLMVGVHLAAVAEAMKFSEHLALDTDLVFDIVSNAAGASAAFSMGFEEMRKGGWSLKSVTGVDEIRDRLVRFAEQLMFDEVELNECVDASPRKGFQASVSASLVIDGITAVPYPAA